MKRVARIAGAVAVSLFSFSQGVSPALAETPPPGPRDISGRYLSTGDSTKSVSIKAVDAGVYRAFGDGWEGVGFFDGATYWGVFHPVRGAGTEPHGTLRGTLRPDGSLAVHGEIVAKAPRGFDVVWTLDPGSSPYRQPRPRRPEGESPDKIRVTPGSDQLPALGDYVYVEELPEAMTKVPPSYPDAARAAKVEGTVPVQAPVGKDGRVRDAQIVKSIPELDEAAGAAVRRWAFRPAMAGGKPVAVWVAVPVRFSLR